MPAPLVIVGAGVAGMSTALAAAPRRVVLVDRGRGGDGGATALAQGGLAAALAPGDTPARHAADTLAAGAHHGDAARVGRLVHAAPEAVAWLARHGVAFDRDACGGWALGREGGHDRARIVHAGGDATGREVHRALARAVAAAPHVERRDRCTLAAVRLQAGRVAGVRLRSDGGDLELETPALVLATGGLGALFAATTNPSGADGFGLALALAAGAAPRDLEFVQFHPTALDVPAATPRPLVTEALRGAGAVLVDAEGRRLLAGAHPLADLAPRDVVARTLWRHRLAGGTTWLDARALPAAAWTQFPTVLALCAAHGLDPRREPLPVVPAAHFHMGGVAVDAVGRSTRRGLFAVGEVACSGVHGANRLASNSLLEGVVAGRRLGGHLASMPVGEGGRGAGGWVSPGAEAGADARQRLRGIVSHALGPVRDGATMRAAIRALDADAGLAGTWQAALAGALLAAAIARPRSLGAHFRVDDTAAASIRRRIATPQYGNGR